MVAGLVEALAGLPAAAKVLLVAALPVVELRGALPVALALGYPMAEAFTLSVVGNLLPIPLVLWLFRPVRDLLARRGPLRPCFDWLERRALARRGQVDRYGAWGLALFVGVPLPGTGAWTGALLALLVGMPVRRAFAAITVGVLMAAVLVAGLAALGLMVVG